MSKLFAIVDATFRDNFDRLTLHRMPGALPFSGKFRLIDFTLSNMRNSNITNVAIFPYGNYRSLQDHVGSGKKWDLDRRKDGLFILPPKNQYIVPGDMITFQRMYEHIEYFKRSTQEYAIITATNIVWNIDFNEVLNDHLKHDADITVVLHENIRSKTYVISKQLLLEYIQSYENLEYRTMFEVETKAPNINIHVYRHQPYTRTITDPFNYLKSNLDMLRFEMGRQVFKENRPVFSKEKTAPPAMYLQNSNISNALVSSGSIVDGTVKNSIIARDVVIKRNATIENSFIMSNSVIEEGASIKYAILDKQTIVKPETIIEGTLRNPYTSQKEQIVTNTESLRVLFVASETHPFIKTGGLADVIGSLSRNLSRIGVDVTVIIPLYQHIKTEFNESLKRLHSRRIMYGEEEYKIRLYSYRYKKTEYYFVESFDFFDTEEVYGYDNDTDRYAFFNKVVVECLDEFDPFDLIHIHDWHTALIPLILDQSDHETVTTLLTLHNINYQGIASTDIIKKLGITDFVFRDEYINFLEIGINTATKLSTVSPTYKEELKYEYYGKNLTYSLLKRERDFYGILNGISSTLKPTRDSLIHTQYNISSLKKKKNNKEYLQNDLNLSKKENALIIGMVTRIVEQKGFDLILHSFTRLLEEDSNIQFVMLGTGDSHYEEQLKELQERYPDQIRLRLGYDSYVPNHIYAGSDVFLMPSRFEPCGLGQMIAMRYGTLPVVRQTGGLNDTVQNYDELTKKGYGFVFYNYEPEALYQTIKRAVKVFYEEKETWKQLQERAMRQDYSIKRSAMRYLELYQTITKQS